MKNKNIIMLCLVTGLGILMISTSVSSTSVNSQINIELKSYSVQWDGAEYKYNVGLSFWNNFNQNEQVLIYYILAEPLNPSPASVSMKFCPNELKETNLTITAPSQVNGQFTISILKILGPKIFSRDYSIMLENNINVVNPVYVNETIFIDVNVDVDVNNTIILNFPDIGFKLLVVGAVIFTAAALYVQTQKIQISSDPKEKLKQKEAERETKGSFFSLAGAIIFYYMGSEYIEFDGFNSLLYGYEIAGLIIAGIIYYLIRGIYGGPKQIKRFGHAFILACLLTLLSNIERWISAVLGIVSLVLYIMAYRKSIMETIHKKIYFISRDTKFVKKSDYFRDEV